MSVIVSNGKGRRSGPKASYPFPNSPYFNYQSPARYLMPLLGKERRFITYEAVVRRQPVVFACVTRLCFWHARVSLEVFQGEDADSRELVPAGTLPELVRKPNPKMRYNGFMRNWLLWDYYVHAHSLAVKFRSSTGAPPSELWPVPWRFCNEIQDQAGMTVAYQVWLNMEMFTLTPDEVVHSQWPRGIGPIESLARTIGIEDAALDYQSEAMRDGMRPRAAFTSPNRISEEDGERLRVELTKLYGPGGEGTFALLHNDLKYDGTIGVSPADLALIDQRKMNKEEVGMAFDVAPPFLGELGRATMSNVETVRDIQYTDSLGPKLEAQVSDWQEQLVDPEPIWSDAGLYLDADMSKILKPSPQAWAAQDLAEQQASTTSTNERRRRRNLPKIDHPDADTVLVPTNMTPLGGTPSPATNVPPAAPPQDSGNGHPNAADAFAALEAARVATAPSEDEDEE
jgi:HK97 family phage portal protein